MTDRILELVVSGVDLDDPAHAARIAENLADLGWASVDGIVTVTVIGDYDPVTEATVIAERIKAYLSNARVVRWHDDLVTTTEIALRAGVTREAVRLWSKARRGPKTFPEPHAHVGPQRSAVWVWGRVSEWLDENGHAGEGLAYPNEAEVATINAVLAGAGGPMTKVAAYLPGPRRPVAQHRQWRVLTATQPASAFSADFEAVAL